MKFNRSILGLLFLAFCFAIVPSAQAASYAIDSIFDDVNTNNYLTDKPTFQGGQTYNVTMQGSGSSPIGIAAANARLGLFVDFQGTRPTVPSWIPFLEPPVISDVATGAGSGFSRSYTITGSFMAPLDTINGDGSAFGFLKLISVWDPITAPGGLLSIETAFFDVNLESAPALPEPTTLALFGLGFMGMVLGKKFYPNK